VMIRFQHADVLKLREQKREAGLGRHEMSVCRSWTWLNWVCIVGSSLEKRSHSHMQKLSKP